MKTKLKGCIILLFVALSPWAGEAATVDAGSDQTITLNGPSVSTFLQGTVSGSSITSISWFQISASSTTPGIASPASTTTLVTFTATGNYVFQLDVYEVPGTTTSNTVSISVQLPPPPTPITKDNVILPQSKNVIEAGQPARIRFRLTTSGTTSMTIYGRGGTVVGRPIDQEFLNAGDHEELWDGIGVSNGTYKVRLEQDGRIIKDFYIVVAR